MLGFDVVFGVPHPCDTPSPRTCIYLIIRILKQILRPCASPDCRFLRIMQAVSRQQLI